MCLLFTPCAVNLSLLVLQTARRAELQPVTDWREGARMEVQRRGEPDAPVSTAKWMRAVVIMRSKNRVKIQFDGHPCVRP